MHRLDLGNSICNKLIISLGLMFKELNLAQKMGICKTLGNIEREIIFMCSILVN